MKRHFTVVELVIVIALIGTLGIIVTFTAYRMMERAQVQKAIKDMRTIAQAAMRHYEDTGQFPPHIDVPPYGAGFLTNDDGQGNEVPGWSGPYLEAWPFHPWARKVVDPTTYQWDYKDVNRDTYCDWTVEIGLGDVNDTRRNYIAGLIDQIIDKGDGPCAGNFQAYHEQCPNWATWPKLIVIDGSNKYLQGIRGVDCD